MAKQIVLAVIDVSKGEEVAAGKEYRIEHIFPDEAIEALEIEHFFAALPQHGAKKSIFRKKKTVIRESWTMNEIRKAYAEMRKKRLKALRKIFLKLAV